MSVSTMNPEVAEEVEKASVRLVEATAEYMTRLNAIADVRTLAKGAHGYTYAVTVDQKDMLEVLPRLAELTLAIEDEFGVKITTLAVAGNTTRAKRPGDAAPASGTVVMKSGRRPVPTKGAFKLPVTSGTRKHTTKKH